MDAFGNIPEYQKAEFLRYVEDKQMKDSLKMYNNLVENCFQKCCMVEWGGSFNSKNLTETENKCVQNCATKYMKLTQRVGFRFAEYQAIKSQEMMQQSQANQK